MEKKLEAYRAKRRRVDMLNKAKENLTTFFTIGKTKPPVEYPPEFQSDAFLETLLVTSDEEFENCDNTSIVEESSNSCTLRNIVFYMTWFTIWAIFFALFVKLEFGAVYFVVTGFIAMYLNTRTGKRKRNEISAYSVFNKNCESIDGTLKAEQLEQQMIYGRLL